MFRSTQTGLTEIIVALVGMFLIYRGFIGSNPIWLSQGMTFIKGQTRAEPIVHLCERHDQDFQDEIRDRAEDPRTRRLFPLNLPAAALSVLFVSKATTFPSCSPQCSLCVLHPVFAMSHLIFPRVTTDDLLTGGAASNFTRDHSV